MLFVLKGPLSMAVIASQFAIVASPIAAVVAVVNYLEPQGINLGSVLMVTIPSTILGIALACVFVNKMGKELKDDPNYQRLLQNPEYVKETVSNIAEIKTDCEIISGLILIRCICCCDGSVSGVTSIIQR